MLDFHYCPRAAWCVLLLRIHMLAALIVYYDFRVHAQFEDVTNAYSLYVESAPGIIMCGVSMHDFDRDGLVDLTYASDGMGVFTYRNTGVGFEQLYLFQALEGFISHPIWVDFDNDSDADFFATRHNDCPVLMRNDGNLAFTDVSDSLECPYNHPHGTCASWGDYNNDGWIDLYIANYHTTPPAPTSWFYRNNGDGSFTQMAEELQIENGVLPAYQVMWVDYDMDLDQDLLICNDKFAGNKLYRNNGDGTFEDWSEESGFGVELDAMSLSVADFDHDSDYDFYISNIEYGNYFMVTEDGYMTNQSNSLNTEVNAFCWGTVFIDSEGNGWEDLYVVNSTIIGGNVLLQNQMGLDFYSDFNAFGQDDTEAIYSVAKGDIDGNGSYDVAVSPMLNNNSRLFQSSLAFEAWVGVDLRGTISNRDGIGAHVSCYAGDVHYIRPKTCGENFLSQDSQYLLFATKNLPVDSIVVQWPSGIRDVLYAPEMNQTHLIIENQQQLAAQAMELSLCDGGSILLEPQGAQQVVWNDGSTELFLEVFEPGTYGAEIIDEQGLSYELIYNIIGLPTLLVELQIEQPSCAGTSDGAIHWLSDESLTVWVNDVLIENDFMADMAPNEYILKFENTYGCRSESLIVLNEPLPVSANSVVSPGCYGDSSHYVIESTQAQGNTFIIGLDDFQGYLPQGAYSYTVMDEMGCSFTSTLQVETMEPFEIQGYTDTVCAGQSAGSVQLQFTGGIEPLLHVSDDLPLEALPPGEYQTQWMDAAGCIASGNIAILQFAPLEIEVEMNVGQIELEIEGGVPPFAIEWSNGDTGLVLIAEPGLYECLVTDAVGCTEQAVAELMVDLEELSRQAASPYPMPFDDVLNWRGAVPSTWSVFNAQGQLVADQTSLRWGRWDTRAWIPGVYVVDMIHTNGHCQRITLVKQ